jgi:preprotein translocase subunit SecY
MMNSIMNIFKIDELRQKILFTLLIILVFRIGTHIPLPGINASALAQFFETLRGTVFGIYDIFVGGALSRASIFALGIMPYISASIIMQLLSNTLPNLQRLQREGEHGRRVINQYSRLLTVLIASVQAFGITSFLQTLKTQTGIPIVPNPGLLFTITTVITLVGGAIFVMWLGEQIDERGIGRGSSVLILIGSLDTFPAEIRAVSNLLLSGTITWINVLIFLVFFILITSAVVVITEVQRRIPIHYAKRVVGKAVVGGQTTYLPLTVNVAGVIPIIFAQSVLIFPQTISTMFPNTQIQVIFQTYFSPGTLIYDILYGILILFFAYFYTSIVLNPKDIADNLQRYGGFIPGIRPGDATAQYIDHVMSRILLPASIFFIFIAIAPYHLSKLLNIPFYFGGTRILIIVGVILDLVNQINSYLIMKQYDALIKKGKIRGWRTS